MVVSGRQGRAAAKGINVVVTRGTSYPCFAQEKKMRKGTIQGVGFSPAMLPVVTGIDRSASRRSWDLRQWDL